MENKSKTNIDVAIQICNEQTTKANLLCRQVMYALIIVTWSFCFAARGAGETIFTVFNDLDLKILLCMGLFYAIIDVVQYLYGAYLYKKAINNWFRLRVEKNILEDIKVEDINTIANKTYGLLKFKIVILALVMTFAIIVFCTHVLCGKHFLH